MYKVLMVAGARPNFMKIAPIIREIEMREGGADYVLVHTGQHYDEAMSDVFFREFDIPTPNYHLNVGSGSHAHQTAKIMMEFEPVCIHEKPDCVLVVGDVNSTLACAIVAKKLNLQLAHVEAGLRSGDMSMPEEVNRLVTDSITDHFFVTEPSGVENLISEGKDPSTIHHVGHVMIDNLFHELSKPDASTEHSLPQDYGVVTLHRPSNVDHDDVLRDIVSALVSISDKIPLVFPAHPRTKAALQRINIELPSTITLLEPLGYREFLTIWRKARIVLTDSGGLQEETTALGVPCLTLRENTERPVTISNGSNKLVGRNTKLIYESALEILEGKTTKYSTPELWDGHAATRILDVLIDKS